MNANNPPPFIDPETLVIATPPALPASPAQPNWANLQIGLRTIANEIKHVHNANPIPLIEAMNDNMATLANAFNANTNAMVDAFNAHTNVMVDAFNAHRAALINTNNAIRDIQETLKLMPMRCYNAAAAAVAASSNVPLQYPPGIPAVPGGPLPVTLADAHTLDGQGYAAAIAALAPGLAPLPGNPTVAMQKAHFLGYLGCPL